MSDTILLIIVPVVALGLVGGVAYLLDRGNKKSGQSIVPPPGPVGKALLWVMRILVALMVLSIIGAFAFQSTLLAWIALGCLGLGIINGYASRLVRLTGK